MTDQRFSRSYDVQQLVELFASVKVGEVVTYEDIAKAGTDHKTPKGAGRIQSARRILQREKQCVFAVVDKVGYMRLDDSEIVKTGATSVARIRRESLRGVKRLACVDYGKLSDADKRKHDAVSSHLGILAECSRPDVVAKIESKVDETKAKLTFDATLDAFRK